MYRLRGEHLEPLQGGQPAGRRQEFEPIFVRNGAIYLVRRDLLANTGRLMGDQPLALIMPRERSVNIDEPVDLQLAEYWLSRQRGE